MRVCLHIYVYINHIICSYHDICRLARAALGDGSWNIDNATTESKIRAADRVRALITVGAIHKPPKGDAASTCVTRGKLYCIQIYMFGGIHIMLEQNLITYYCSLYLFIRCPILFG